MNSLRLEIKKMFSLSYPSDVINKIIREKIDSICYTNSGKRRKSKKYEYGLVMASTILIKDYEDRLVGFGYEYMGIVYFTNKQQNNNTKYLHANSIDFNSLDKGLYYYKNSAKYFK